MNKDLPRSLPEAQGVSSSAILAFLDGIFDNPGELHSLIVVRHGHVVAEGYWAPYSADRQHLLYSLSKSFTSTAAGFAIEEGALRLDDKVVSFFPDSLPAEVSPNLAAMTVRDLLVMGTGHTSEPSFWSADGSIARAFLATPVEKAPGTHFLYNTPATYMVSAIVKKATGQDVVAYLQSRLFEPLGIATPKTERCPLGIPLGGTGMYVTTNDIAKFGQVYLQRGVWNGERLLSEDWIETATTKQISNGDDPESDWAQGYGFQFWRCRHDAYRGDGAFGQYCVVLPEQDTVVAITSGVPDMGHILNLIWERLLPGLQASALPEDPAAAAALSDRLKALSIRGPEGAAESPVATGVSGRTYHFPENDQGITTARLDFDPDGVALHLQDTWGEHTVAFGMGKWRSGTTTFLMKRISPALPFETAATAGQAAWTDAGTLTAKLCLLDTPFCPILTFDVSGDTLILTVAGSIGFGPSERSPIVGR